MPFAPLSQPPRWCSVVGAAALWLAACTPGESTSQAPQGTTSSSSSAHTAGGGASQTVDSRPDATSGSSPATQDGGCPASTTTCGGSCIDLAASAANCGACGNACPSGLVCQSGTCACRTGQTLCAGQCVDTTSSVGNCGACGAACAAGLVCSESHCGSGCATGLSDCSGSCVDTTGSPTNCGTCGNACPSDQSCWMSACICPTGQGPCGAGGACVDITANDQNCGACGTACATGATCTASVCACPTGQTVCSGVCVDTNTDNNQCGGCGTVCTASGTECLYGACIDPSSVTCGAGDGGEIDNSCTANAQVLLGKYWVNNNQWGVASNGATGQQCVWGTCQTGDLVGWGTSWSWGETNPSAVKTYASLVFGWQYGWVVANTGLPVQIAAGNTVDCGWNFTVAQTGTIDVSFDTWLHTISDPGTNSTPSEEVMVWVYRAGGAAPISSTGTPVASGISLAGATWDLYQGSNPNWPVSSYVRTSNATTVTMNMMVFYDDLVTRGWIPNTRYLSSIQAGTEVFNGNGGTLTTDGFYCRIQ